MLKKNGDPYRVGTRRSFVTGGLFLGAITGGGFLLASDHHDKKHARLSQFSTDQPQRQLNIAWPNHERDALWHVANQQGFFERFHLKVNIFPASSGQDVIAALKGGQVEIGIASVLRWIPAIKEGLPIQMLAGLHAGTFRLFVKKHSDINRLADLAGHTIGVADSSENGLDRLYFSLMMRRHGFNPYKDVLWKQYPYAEMLKALENNEIQAIAGHDPDVWGVYQQQGKKIWPLFTSLTGQYAMRVNRVLAARTVFIEKDREALKTLVAALHQAVIWIKQHLKEASVMLAPYLSSMSSNQILQMMTTESQGVAPVGHNLVIQVAQTIDELKLLGIIPEEVNSLRYAQSISHNILP